jgi:hypothetical protein
MKTLLLILISSFLIFNISGQNELKGVYNPTNKTFKSNDTSYSIYEFVNGYAKFCRHNLFGILDSTGRVICPSKFQYILFSREVCPIDNLSDEKCKLKNDHYGIAMNDNRLVYINSIGLINNSDTIDRKDEIKFMKRFHLSRINKNYTYFNETERLDKNIGLDKLGNVVRISEDSRWNTNISSKDIIFDQLGRIVFVSIINGFESMNSKSKLLSCPNLYLKWGISSSSDVTVMEYNDSTYNIDSVFYCDRRNTCLSDIYNINSISSDTNNIHIGSMYQNSQEEKYFLINNYGKILTKRGYFYIQKNTIATNTSTFYFIASIKDTVVKFGLLNQLGDEIVHCNYEEIGNSSLGGMLLVKIGNKFGFLNVNDNCNLAIPLIYDYASGFYKEQIGNTIILKARVRINDTSFTIGVDGKKIE